MVIEHAIKEIPMKIINIKVNKGIKLWNEYSNCHQGYHQYSHINKSLVIDKNWKCR